MMKKGLLLFGVVFFLCSMVFVSAETWSFTEPFNNGVKSFSSSNDFSNGFSIDVRFMPTTVTHAYIVQREGNFLLQVTANKKIECGMTVGTAWVPLVVSNSVVQKNIWYTVKCDYNGTVAKLYVNNVLVSSKNYVASLPNNFKNITIGNNMQKTRGFIGYISNVNLTSKVQLPVIVDGYQESASQIAYSPGIWRLNKSPWTSGAEAGFDGDWTTDTMACNSSFDAGDGFILLNYTKPVGVNSAVWQVKYDYRCDYPRVSNTTNLTIPNNCMTGDNIQLRVNAKNWCNPYSTGDSFDFSCYDGGRWVELLSIPTSCAVELYEEGLYLVVSNNTVNPNYQEYADFSSCNDASCDGNWLSSDYSSQQISYLKNGHSGANWMLKDECGYFNISIPSSCFNYDSKYLNLSYLRGEGFGGLYLYCQDVPGECKDFQCSWTNEIASRPDCGDLSEEGVLWNKNMALNQFTLRLCDDNNPNNCYFLSIPTTQSMNTLWEEITNLIYILVG